VGFLKMCTTRFYAMAHRGKEGWSSTTRNLNQPLDLIRLSLCNSRNLRIRTPVEKVVLKQVASVMSEPTARGGKLWLFR
jgi:hypothetical protein